MSGIHEALAAIMEECGAITKGRKNKHQGYNFRGVDDVYYALNPLMTKHNVFTSPEILDDRHEERKSGKGGVLIYRVFKIKYTFYHKDGSSLSAVVIGEGMDSGDKASNKAMSVAHKYALLQMFCIPTEEPKDSENDSPKPVPKSTFEQIKEALGRCGHISEIDKVRDDFAPWWKTLTDKEQNAIRGIVADMKAAEAQGNEQEREFQRRSI